MFIDVVPNRQSPPAVLLRESWREGRVTKKRTLANLSHWPEAKVALLRRLLRDEPLVSPDALFTVDRTRCPMGMSTRCCRRCGASGSTR